MKKKIMLFLILAISSTASIANTMYVYVSATSNTLGPYGGNYRHVKVPPNVTHEISINRINAIFNTNDRAKFANLAVMYVEPPRKMTIKTINTYEKTYVNTEGNLYFFFVDDARLNSGGASLKVTQVNL